MSTDAAEDAEREPDSMPEHELDPDQDKRTSSAPRRIDAEVEALIADAERTLADIRRQLAEHRDRVDQEAEQDTELEQLAAQHAEIDRLAEHLELARVNWGQVRAFFQEVVDQLFGRRSGS